MVFIWGAIPTFVQLIIILFNDVVSTTEVMYRQMTVVRILENLERTWD